MAMDWVQAELTKRLGFIPFPATLNLHPKGKDDAQTWAAIRGLPAIALPVEGGFCSARLYRILIHRPANFGGKMNAAILVPNVADYPKDKIEIVAPVQLKEAWGVRDGDSLTLEFVN
jgi:riboflavin kinase, archaea type